MKIRVIAAAMVYFLFFPVLSEAKDVLIIGNPSVKAGKLTKRDVSKIFLGKKIAWDDNTRIVIALQKNPAIHKAFLKEYIHKSASRFASIWKRKIFTGMIAPKTFESDDEVVRYVSETKGAIGYVSANTNVDDVKTISIK